MNKNNLLRKFSLLPFFYGAKKKLTLNALREITAFSDEFTSLLLVARISGTSLRSPTIRFCCRLSCERHWQYHRVEFGVDPSYHALEVSLCEVPSGCRNQ